MVVAVSDVERKLMLIDVLSEEADLNLEPPAEAAKEWSEAQIRAWFAKQAGGEGGGGVEGEHGSDGALEDDAGAGGTGPEDVVKRWFPSWKGPQVACRLPRARVLCFPCAGSGEDMYSKSGKSTYNGLVSMCTRNRVEMLAVQPPGRGARGREAFLPSAQAIAEEAAAAFAAHVEREGRGDAGRTVPWFLVGHSVGTWVAYETARRLTSDHGFPPPLRFFLSSFPAPDIDPRVRPWRYAASADPDDVAFKKDAATWGTDPMVFSAAMWGTQGFGALLRADFSLFDTYALDPERPSPTVTPTDDSESPPLAPPPPPHLTGVAATLFSAQRDAVVTRDHVQDWLRFLGAPAETSRLESIDGTHLFPVLHQDAAARAKWLDHVCIDILADLKREQVRVHSTATTTESGGSTMSLPKAVLLSPP